MTLTGEQKIVIASLVAMAGILLGVFLASQGGSAQSAYPGPTPTVTDTPAPAAGLFAQPTGIPAVQVSAGNGPHATDIVPIATAFAAFDIAAITSWLPFTDTVPIPLRAAEHLGELWQAYPDPTMVTTMLESMATAGAVPVVQGYYVDDMTGELHVVTTGWSGTPGTAVVPTTEPTPTGTSTGISVSENIVPTALPDTLVWEFAGSHFTEGVETRPAWVGWLTAESYYDFVQNWPRLGAFGPYFVLRD